MRHAVTHTGTNTHALHQDVCCDAHLFHVFNTARRLGDELKPWHLINDWIIFFLFILSLAKIMFLPIQSFFLKKKKKSPFYVYISNMAKLQCVLDSSELDIFQKVNCLFYFQLSLFRSHVVVCYKLQALCASIDFYFKYYIIILQGCFN